MNGAEAALAAAARAGIEVCFANPGTTEIDFVDALDRTTGIRPVLALAEGVATGAADGYARMRGTPALTLLHLGPGLANGLANLHNARRAHSPVINLVGDHASWHLRADAPLTSDIEAIASAVSAAVVRLRRPEELAAAVPAAVARAITPPTGVITLIAEQDAAWGETALLAATAIPPHSEQKAPVEQAAALLAQYGEIGALLLGGSLDAHDLQAAAAIRAATGCQVWLDTFLARVAGGAGVPRFPSVPYFPEDAARALAGVTALVAVGTRPPVAFFGYREGKRSDLLHPGAETLVLAQPGWPASPALQALADAVADGTPQPTPGMEPLTVPSGDLDVRTLGATLAALQPENAIVVNEAATSALHWTQASVKAKPHDVLSLTGGAIGFGLPAAVGAAIAAPDRPVIALQADGSAMYTVQALWTMARESLDVTVVLCNNRSYRILQAELARAGCTAGGPAAKGLTDLAAPTIDWTGLARSMGVPALRATTVSELAAGLKQAQADQGPLLIEAVLP